MQALMGKRRLPLLVLAAASCVASRAPSPEADVTRVVRARFAAAAALDLQGYASTLAADAILVGPTAQDVHLGPDDAVAAWRRALSDGRGWARRRHSRSTRLRVNLGADGQTAWISDLLEIDVDVGVARGTLPIRVSEVLGLQHGRWVVLASHWSVAVPEDEALDAAAEGRWPPLVPIPDIVDDGADELADQISRDLRDPETLSASIDDAADFVFIGAADEYVVGARHARELLRRKAADVGLELSREGKNRVALAPGGRFGWTVTNLDVRTTLAGDVVALRLRALLVYEQRGGAWRLVHAHLSHGLADP